MTPSKMKLVSALAVPPGPSSRVTVTELGPYLPAIVLYSCPVYERENPQNTVMLPLPVTLPVNAT